MPPQKRGTKTRGKKDIAMCRTDQSKGRKASEGQARPGSQEPLPGSELREQV